MEIYSQLHSTVLHNGKRILCDLNTWAMLVLPDDKKHQLQLDFDELSNFFANYVTTETIHSTAKDSLGNEIVIGMRYIFHDVFLTHPKYEYWQNEFANDSSVVTYRQLVKE